MLIKTKKIVLILALIIILSSLIYILTSIIRKEENKIFDASFIKNIEEDYNERETIYKSRENRTT